MTATVEKLHAIMDELKVSMENVVTEVAEFSAQVCRLREEVSNADLICCEETATNEEAIKDVQDAQLKISMRRLVRQFILHNRVYFPKTGPSKVLQQKSGGRY